ncbi:MAG: hypothetical protein J0I84_06965 [Terrimonas sp.]|nr:hypothetical protein [Terrimonas sp.]OJY93288.1 MAG: hypothetical protein BGP13_16800 [Sphingobacteriales bacterium 40-81]
MPDQDEFSTRTRLFRRDEHPLPLRADFYEGDKLTTGLVIRDAHSAVLGVNNVTRSKGVIAGSIDNIPDVGIGGRSDAKYNAGVYGYSEHGTGVYCKSVSYEALHAETQSFETAAIAAYQMNPESESAALYAAHADPNKVAAVFKGNVHVHGDILLMNADIAEDFTIADSLAEVGSVMVFDKDGSLIPCNNPYDKKVVGVISGAGSYKPGMILDKQKEMTNRLPIALMGKVYCKVDADFNPIEIGDLLTTSATLGCAMKAIDSSKSFGTVIGKALMSLDAGKGLIPILVTLQ